MNSAEVVLDELRAADQLLAIGDAEGSASARERAHELLYALGSTIASFDAEAAVWRFGHEPSGPAGAAVVRVAGGTMLCVDYADPARLVAMTTPVDANGSVGTEGRAAVAAAISAQAAGLLDGVPGEDARAVVRFDAGDAFHALARLAVLDRARQLDEDRRGASPLWAAEAAVLCARAAEVPGCSARARAEAATCAGAVRALAESGVPARLRAPLSELVAELRPLVSSPADREDLRHAARALRANEAGRARGWREHARSLRAGPGAPAIPRLALLAWTSNVGMRSTRRPDRPGGQPQPSATFAISRSYEPLGLSSTRRARLYWDPATGILEVTCRTTPDGQRRVGDLWVRAFLPPQLTLLDSAALAVDPDEPPDEEGRWLAVARLELTPGDMPQNIAIDITPEPAEPPAESTLGLMRRAREAGEAAAAAERAGQDAQAAELWETAAGLWSRAGAEEQRYIAEILRAQALERASQHGAAALREELVRRLPAAQWRVEQQRAPVQPFIGEESRPGDAATG